MTTSAQAEGAIEGIWSDYQVLGDYYSPNFKYSRFWRVARPLQRADNINRRTAWSSERGQGNLSAEVWHVSA